MVKKERNISHKTGEIFSLGNLEITVTPAFHPHQLHKTGFQTYFKPEDCCGFKIKTPDGTIWIPGDSLLMNEHLEMKKENPKIEELLSEFETIYNRIHEIRTRFEVLHRDATIKYYEQLLKNPGNKHQLEEELSQSHKKLTEDFEFIAMCNIGGEFMEQSNIDKLESPEDLTIKIL